MRAKGDRAEAAVADYLVADGFEILGRNVRLGPLEVDIVARRGELAVVVEVRSRGRGAFARGLESVDGKKRVTLLRAAERLWREQLAALPGVERMRLDVASVTFDGEKTVVEYIPSAFTA